MCCPPEVRAQISRLGDPKGSLDSFFTRFKEQLGAEFPSKNSVHFAMNRSFDVRPDFLSVSEKVSLFSVAIAVNTPSSEISHILVRLRQGDLLAEHQLIEAVHIQLYQIAQCKLKTESDANSLQATALVNEVWLRLVDKEGGMPTWENQRHFFGAASLAMQRILVELYRKRSTLKRGGGRKQQLIELDELSEKEHYVDDDLEALNQGLQELEKIDPIASELVRLRYYAGLSLSATAEIMGLSQQEAGGLWRYAKNWLKAFIRDSNIG
jgi:RNA polymerase sigma factor (TIGR02999 family)